MGQLEAYGIHEIYLTGMMVGLFLNYVAEKHESDTFENMKSYFYSANFSKQLTKKIKSIKLSVSTIYTSENAAFLSTNLFNINNGWTNMTKLIDDFTTWQNSSLVSFKVDEHVVGLEQKYTQ